jgi:hypothetical protein
MPCVREQGVRVTVGDNDSLAGLERHSNPGLFSTAPYLGPHLVTKYTLQQRSATDSYMVWKVE